MRETSIPDNLNCNTQTHVRVFEEIKELEIKGLPVKMFYA